MRRACRLVTGASLRGALARAEAAERELRNRQVIVDDMGRLAHIGAWQLDASTLTFERSDEVYRIHGVEPGDGEALRDSLRFYAPESRQVITDAVRRALEDGTPFDLVLPFETASGERRWVRSVGSAVREAGAIRGLRGALQDVTETHEIQERLVRASRASAEGHWEFDFRTQRAWLSASLQELLGAEARERSCTGEEFWQLLDAEDIARVQHTLARHLDSGAPYDVELRIRCANGARRWFRSRATAEFDASGQPLRIGGSIIDIETEKVARDELEALRRRYDRALRGTQDGLWDWNLGTGDCWVSPRFRELLGYDGDDTTSLPNSADAFMRLLHPEDEPRLRAATQRHLETGESHDIELRLRTRAGAYRWFRSRGCAERDAAGAPVSMAGSVQDIEQQKQSEFEHAEAKRRLARAIDGSTDALYEIDLENGGPGWYSPRIREMLQYAPDDPFPDSLFALINEEDRERVRLAIEEHNRTGLPYESVFPLLTKRGELRWLRSRGRTERDETGKPRRFSGSIQDITTQVATEGALRAATESAAAANRAKGDFLANMSHEIRTPLHGVLGMTELLLEGPLEPGQRAHAETILASGSSLLGIINDILDLSKIEAGKLTFESVPMDARDCLQQTHALLESQACKRGLRFHTEIAADVPATVRGDPLRLRQILLNIAGNALKFTPAGEVCVRVQLVERTGAEAVLQFEIRDTGVGMTPETIARLFTPFTQADPSTTRHYGGTGLGLSIVQRLLAQLGGSIRVTSELGAGSCFSVRWPCTVLADEGCDAARPARPVGARPAARLHGRVLIVEDHPVNQQVARRQLERVGCTVVIADNGALGADLALAEHFDLILMDVQMPILDGYAATRRIRAAEGAGRHVPIIAATAGAMTDEIEQCLEAGMDDFLTKPIDRVKLHSLLCRYLPASEALVADAAGSGSRDAAALAAEAAPGARTGSVIDTQTLRALIGDDREFALALTSTFIESARDMLRAIEAATVRGERALLGTLGHRLLGAAHSAGALELGFLAQRLEQEAPRATPEALADLGRELARAYAATVDSLGSLGLKEQVA